MPRSPALPPRLLSAASFTLALQPDGRAYVVRDREPYEQYWLSDTERLVFALCARRGGMPVTALSAAMATLAVPAGARRLQRTLADMLQAGVLVDPAADDARYTATMVEAYRRHRPFPPGLTAALAEAAGLQPGQASLDLAGGPGDLALQLARRGARASLMDVSTAFLRAARAQARHEALGIETLRESANRLVQRDEAWDLITVSQALHWLDDVAVCRGVLRTLRPGGHFVVVQAAMDLADTHPLAPWLGRHSVLGAQGEAREGAAGFRREVAALARRLGGLFDALDSPDVPRLDPTRRWQGEDGRPAHGLHLAALRHFTQPRPIGLGFARAFLSPSHLTGAGLSEAEAWAEIEARCAAARPRALQARMHWALLVFRRGAPPAARVRSGGRAGVLAASDVAP
jgi:SAM-dependent methyltransferase